MISQNMLKHSCFLLSSILLISISETVIAEEMLFKQENKYLGWQTGKDQFKTCNNRYIQVGDGKVEKTGQKCERRTGPGPLMTKGEVERVDTNKNTFTIRDASGQSHEFFYRASYPASEGLQKTELKDLKAGDKVIVNAPIAGRADSISPVGTTEEKPSGAR